MIVGRWISMVAGVSVSVDLFLAFLGLNLIWSPIGSRDKRMVTKGCLPCHLRGKVEGCTEGAEVFRR